MNKILTFLLLASAFLLGACSSQSDDDLRGIVTVKITAKLDTSCHQSRSNPEETTTRCYLEIISNAVSHGLTPLENLGNETYSLVLPLYKGTTYQFYFWADQGPEYFSFTGDDDNADFTTANLCNVIMLKSGIGYWGLKSFDPQDDESTLSVTLSHAVAKISLVTNTDLLLKDNIDGNKVNLTIPKTYPAFDAHLGKVLGYAENYSYEAILTENQNAESTVLVAYAFADNDAFPLQTVNLQYGYAPAVEVSNVPIATNTHTKLYGDITNQASVPVTANISTSWGSQDTDIQGAKIEAVDLGLSVLWGSCNLGASTPEEAGDYYQWGSLKVGTTGRTGEYEGEYSSTEWPEAYDPATAFLGSGWRVPTKGEWEELLNLAKTNVDYSYRTFESSTTGNSILIPYCKYYYGGSLVDKYRYWTATSYDNSFKYIFDMESRSVKNANIYYYYSLPIRPVKDID